MVKMNPKTIVTNILLLLLLLQISSGVVFSLILYRRRADIEPIRIPVARILLSNELYGLKKGNAGFICADGPKYWQKSKPGDWFVVTHFSSDVRLHGFVNCHLRSNRGYVNFRIHVHPDTAARCHPSYTCRYLIRKDGVYYKPENKLFPWRPYPPRSKKGRLPKA